VPVSLMSLGEDILRIDHVRAAGNGFAPCP
jgi:hypothetical protein